MRVEFGRLPDQARRTIRGLVSRQWGRATRAGSPVRRRPGYGLSLVPPGEGEEKEREAGARAMPLEDLERRGPSGASEREPGWPVADGGETRRGVQSRTRGPACRATWYGAAIPSQQATRQSCSKPQSYRPAGPRMRPPNGVTPVAGPLPRKRTRDRGTASLWANTAASRGNGLAPGGGRATAQASGCSGPVGAAGPCSRTRGLHRRRRAQLTREGVTRTPGRTTLPR
jgi:hypothetical protein